MAHARALAVSLSFAVVLTACSDERWEAYASEADEAVDAAASEAALFVAPAEGAQPMTTPEAQASAAASSASTYFSPEGCVTATSAGATVTYVLDHCVGPFGFAVLTGTVIVTYAPAARGVAFTAVTDDLAVNQATVDFDHEGTLVTSESGERTLTIRADASGRGGRGTGFGREGDYTVTWDEARTCIGVDGTWSTTVGALAWRTEVTGYDRCVESCPMSGGRIGWSSASGAITVTYDGSSTARWSVDGRRDREGTVELLCGE